MAGELKKMAIKVEELPDGLVIHHSNPEPANVHGHGDHRIVMAMSLAGMAVDGESEIDTAEAMSVTFPTFVDLMKNIGADMKLEK
jgi:3-phosphoshikimate 1-carboxyvinyltransferase